MVKRMMSAILALGIGTVDHPTIDGVFIDGKEKQPIIEVKKSKEKIDDSWVSDKHVKQLLKSAARDGKLDYVLKKSDTMGLPASVALLPMIESGYSNTAISNKGAAGAWQLMPMTAKAYGLNSQDRYQFTTATDAALLHLQNLYRQFGNWELAFAAYNAGANRIAHAHARDPNATSVNQLSIPLETKQYINRMIALNNSLAGLI